MPTSLRVAAAFVELINAQDLRGIVDAVTDDSRFFVEGESPTVGRERLRAEWSVYPGSEANRERFDLGPPPGER